MSDEIVCSICSKVVSIKLISSQDNAIYCCSCAINKINQNAKNKDFRKYMLNAAKEKVRPHLS